MYPYVSIHTRTHTQCVRVLGERMGGNKKTTLGERVRILGNRAKQTRETQVRFLSLFSTASVSPAFVEGRQYEHSGQEQTKRRTKQAASAAAGTKK